MSGKYINNNKYQNSGYTISGVYQSITIGPKGLIGGVGLVGGASQAYTIANLGKIVGTDYAGVALGDGGVVTNGDSSHLRL